ncbi:hypothetical protein INT43_003357 [Umbelopsis isabellina]|uniref:Methyltransferase domain-containing protein n=1 Tax=Mortierella isabellina TaxID=91625 RepID=A0A8H7UG87_MORIS|nr:hypothetical protein INT43_003357 [Umbelopsis isabellina]
MTDITTSLDATTKTSPPAPPAAHRRRQSWLRGNSFLSLLPELSSYKKRRSQSLGNVRLSEEPHDDTRYSVDTTYYQEPDSPEFDQRRRRSSDRSTSTKSSISSLFAKVARKRNFIKRENSLNLQSAPSSMTTADCKPYVPFVSAFDDPLLGHRNQSKRHSTSSSSTAIGPEYANGKVSPPASSPRLAYIEALQPDKKLDLDEIRNDAYPIENDEVEVDRLQAKNDLVKLAFDGDYCAPLDFTSIEYPRILDIGCGAGSWCIDLARRYPDATVFGLDCQDIFPDPKNIPSNCHLLVHNVLHGLKQYPDGWFDYVHCRFMMLAFSPEQYIQVMTECIRVTRKHGFVEVMEMDLRIYGDPTAGPLTQQLNEEVIYAAESLHLSPRVARNLDGLFPNTSNISSANTRYLSMPIGMWGGRLGVLFKDDLFMFTKKCQTAVAQARNRPARSDEEFMREMERVSREVEAYRCFMNFHAYWVEKA